MIDDYVYIRCLVQLMAQLIKWSNIPFLYLLLLKLRRFLCVKRIPHTFHLNVTTVSICSCQIFPVERALVIDYAALLNLTIHKSQLGVTVNARH